MLGERNHHPAQQVDCAGRRVDGELARDPNLRRAKLDSHLDPAWRRQSAEARPEAQSGPLGMYALQQRLHKVLVGLAAESSRVSLNRSVRQGTGEGRMDAFCCTVLPGRDPDVIIL